MKQLVTKLNSELSWFTCSENPEIIFYFKDYTDKKYLSKLTKQNATIYNEPITGQQLNRMIPPGKREKEFNQLLASKFKMVGGL